MNLSCDQQQVQVTVIYIIFEKISRLQIAVEKKFAKGLPGVPEKQGCPPPAHTGFEKISRKPWISGQVSPPAVNSSQNVSRAITSASKNPENWKMKIGKIEKSEKS